MSEPEEVILDGAHYATRTAASLWRRLAPRPPEPLLALADVKQRVELFAAALFAEVPPIGIAEPPAIPNWFARAAWRMPRHLVERRALASTDGAQLRLPRTLRAGHGLEAAVAWYRLLAAEQAIRAERGTPRLIGEARDALVRDLYLLAESAAVDRFIALELPGLLAELCAGRSMALAARPAFSVLTAVEQRMELLLQELLRSEPAWIPAWLPDAGSNSNSLEWARAAAVHFRGVGGRYRGLPAVEVWGRASAAAEGSMLGVLSGDSMEDSRVDGKRVTRLSRRPSVRRAAEDEDDSHVGIWMIQIDDPKESVEDPMGLQRPTDRDDNADPDDLADSLSELPEARLVPIPGAPREVLVSDDPPPRTARLEPGLRTRSGIAYPEWDFRSGAYLSGRAVVREHAPPAGTTAWAEGVLRRHAREVQAVRRRFERLRPRRLRLGRQVDGPEVDLSAYVTSVADRRAGGAADDRLYEAVRPMRRDLAIMLLVDVSGSTDSWVAGSRRIIDVEKEALLLVCEALDALGDRYAILAFSGEGPESVSLSAVKEFGERYGDATRRRIGALEPDRFTRSGAAIRHATAVLCRERAQHRLMLVLSDGKPNDVDVYEGRYGVEDTRQAVVEARLQGIHPFCLTVDREAPAYLSRIFGRGAYGVLREAERLPAVLLEVLRRLLEA